MSTKTDFWRLPYGEIKKKKRSLESQTPTEIRKILINHWHDHSTPEVLLKQTVGLRISSLRQNEVSNSANNASSTKRQCQNCSKKANGRMKVSESHDTANCFYGDKSGWDRQETASIAEYSSDISGANKPANLYFYDTGATPKSFVKEKPLNFFPKHGAVVQQTDSHQRHLELEQLNLEILRLQLHLLPPSQRT